MGRGASREQGCAKSVDRKYRLDYDEQHLYLSHKVGRSLCMLMCAGLGLFLCAIGVITLVAESVYEPCDLEPAEGPSPQPCCLQNWRPVTCVCDLEPAEGPSREPPPPPPPPQTEVGPLGTGSVGCAPLNATGAERGFVMYSAEAVGTRFAGYPDTGGAEHFACVAWVGGLEPGWRLQAGAQPPIGRSLAPSDVLVASFEPGFGSPTLGEGAREELGAAGGATFGYASGDLEISRDGNTTTFLVNGAALVAPPPPPPPAPPPPVSSFEEAAPEADAPPAMDRDTFIDTYGSGAGGAGGGSKPAPCRSDETGCVETRRVEGSEPLVPWAFPGSSSSAAAALKATLAAGGATTVSSSAAGAGATRVTASFSAGPLGLISDDLEFVLSDATHTTEYRASASAKNLVFGDGAGRNKGRLSGVRKKLFEEQGWSCACPSDVGFVEGLKCSLFCG